MIQDVGNLQSGGYVQITNMAGFVAAFEISYTLNFARENFETDTILIGGVRKKDIPVGATDIYVKVSIANMGGKWVPIYNNNFNNSTVVVDLELSGTMWNPSYYVIKETNPAGALIKIFNYGAFITQFKVEYYLNGRLYELKIPGFYLGMVRNVMLPADAKNINVYMEIDAIGWGYWWKAYEETFESAINLTITLSGTYGNPGIDVKKEELVNKVRPIETSIPATPMNTSPAISIQPCDCSSYSDELIKQYTSFMESMYNEFIKNTLNNK